MDHKVYKISNIGEGSLSIMPKPLAGESINTVLSDLHTAGLSKLVSLLEIDEARSFGLENEAKHCGENSLAFLHFPIPDFSIPTNVDAFVSLVQELHQEMYSGANIGVHCRAGIGRSGLLATSVLIYDGNTAKMAIDRVSKARGIAVPETDEQIRFVHHLGDRQSKREG